MNAGTESTNRELTYPRLCLLIAEKPTRLSQAMHNAGFKAANLPYFYVAADVSDTAAAIAAIRTLGARGASLTIPHKERAFELVDTLSSEAKAIGAINTVINDGCSLSGENTDWVGVVEALNETSYDFQGKTALVVGAGGAARAGIFALKQLGLGKILVTNRTAERAISASKEFEVDFLSASDLTKAGKVDLIVQATPSGSHLAEAQSSLLTEQTLTTLAPQVIFEMVTRDTSLLRWGRNLGITTVSGSRMLLFQALEQFKLFTGEPAPKTAMEAALTAELNR